MVRKSETIDDATRIYHTCPGCEKENIILVSKTDLDAYLHKNIPIQDTFPYLTLDERETIISGLCSKCQKIYKKIEPL